MPEFADHRLRCSSRSCAASKYSLLSRRIAELAAPLEPSRLRGGLGAGFGSLNYDYAANNRLKDLESSRSFAFGPRIIQLGFRVSF